MGEALYRKYRSKNLGEVVGQEHVTTTLKNALKSGKISHAYLLTGPRGTGKTSIARILAHEVNNLPYSDAPHLDIIEIDAASNRRIDEVRDIRDKVRIAPSSATYKVYIIDEVHMLTKEAFNALLKTLEEPPKHAIFILATTEVHKLPDTIISRTQRFNLKPISAADISAHLTTIAKSEKIKASPEALDLIAVHSNGGLRDAISLFDQLASHQDTIEAEDVRSLLGIAPQESIKQLATAVQSGTPKELIQLLSAFEDQGLHAPQVAHQLSEIWRQNLIDNPGSSSEGDLKLLSELSNIPQAHQPQKSLELTLLGYILARTPKTAAQPQSNPTEPSPAIPLETKVHKTTAQTKPPTKESRTKEEAKPVKVQTPPAPTIVLGDEMSPEAWQAVLNAVKQTHNTLYGIVRMAKPILSDDTLTLSFGFPFHQKRMNEAKNRQLIQDIVKDVSGKDLTVICIIGAVSETPQTPPTDEQEVIKPVQVTNKSDTLDTITDIFGGGEVLES